MNTIMYRFNISQVNNNNKIRSQYESENIKPSCCGFNEEDVMKNYNLEVFVEILIFFFNLLFFKV